MTERNGISNLTIDLDALAANYHQIVKNVNHGRVMPILKADAYGHGLVPCALRLEKEGAKIVGVAFLEEALELRENGFKASILPLGGLCGEQIGKFIKNDIDMCASSVMKLKAIDKTARQLNKRAKIHLKIDTGLGRIGQSYLTAENLLNQIDHCKNCDLVSIFSHLACPEDPSQSFSKVQLERFQRSLLTFCQKRKEKPILHMACSGAILGYKESHLDLVRPGLILFGVYPEGFENHPISLTPVLSLHSQVVFFKVIPPGMGVSYGLTWQSEKETRIITLPIGYGDGLSRRLSHKGRVLVRHSSYPIVGRICMDQLIVDLGPQGEAYNGDSVTIIGGNGPSRISIEEMARMTEEDPRDLLLRLSLRLNRRYIDNYL